MDSAFEQSLIDGMQATSVLWAFLAVLFALQYPLIAEDADSKPPEPRDVVGRDQYRKRLKCTLLGRVLPLMLFLWAFAIMALPSSLTIIITFRPTGNYDYVRASWAFTDAVLFGFAIWITLLGNKVWQNRSVVK